MKEFYTVFISLLFLIVILLICHWLFINYSRFAPGPLSLPFFGNVLSFGNLPHETFAKWSQKYGPVFQIYFGSQRAVILNDYNVIKEAFYKQGDIFNGRPDFFITKIITKGEGLSQLDGSAWQEQRRFALSTLRDFGMGKYYLEERIQEEMMDLINEINKKQTFDIHPLLKTSVANIICYITFGRRFNYDDPKFNQFLDYINILLSSNKSGSILNLFPWMRLISRKFYKIYYELNHISQKLRDFYNCIIIEHLKDNHDISDYIDAYLHQQQYGHFSFTDAQLNSSLHSLFLAGTETTSSTLYWAFFYMIHHLDIQQKVQKELDSVIMDNRLPSCADQGFLPFTKATILEIQRIASIAPLALPHKTTKDTILNGFHIPANTIVFANLWNVHRDPKIWKEPYIFYPSRFLNEKNELVKFESLIPFSIGKRFCPGASLAKTELFLIFTSLLQHFNFRLPEGFSSIDPKPQGGLTIMPSPFLLQVTKRNRNDTL